MAISIKQLQRYDGFPITGAIGEMVVVAFGGDVGPQLKRALRPSRRVVDISAFDIRNEELFFYAAVFSILACLARADGQFSCGERDVVKRFMRRGLELNATRKDIVARIFHAAYHSEHTLSEFASEFVATFGSDDPAVEMLLDLLVALATADNELSDEEEKLITQAARIFKIPEKRLQAVIRHYCTDKNSPYGVLGCDPSDSNEDIVHRYNELVHHFNRSSSSSDAPAELKESQAAERAAVTQAFEKIAAERGLTIEPLKEDDSSPDPRGRPLAVGLIALLTSVFSLSPTGASAASLAGVTYPDAIEMDGTPLVLNGLGLREATIFAVDVYVAALYLPNRSADPEQILQQPMPKRLSLHFVREVSASQMRDAWKEGVSKNLPEPQRFDAAVESLNRLMPDVQEGDELVFDFFPSGLSVSLNRNHLGDIDDELFARELLRVWLGPKPPNSGLKRGLLGK
ncbi:MAG: chalcone isomerase family protein [Bdellovibrionales bacterium]|nr:chalcone isomerase family protein [Bdellovibrionales bacterium]